MFYAIAAVFVGGGFGAVLRYLITYLSKILFQMPIIGTFTANLIGSFLIGLVFALTLDKLQNISPIFKLLVTVGFLGGLTTFSTFSLEGFELIKAGKIGIAILYIISSCIISLLLVFIGYFFATKL